MTRREALGLGTGVAVSWAWSGCRSFTGGTSSAKAVRAAPRLRKPGEKLNIGVIGVGGKGWSNWEPMFKMGENIVALCDADRTPVDAALAIVRERNKDAKGFSDYRKMLDECKNLDVVLVSTPDHMHAPAAVRAMRQGCHVYVEKPLVRTIWEARTFERVAKECGVVTQMGNQGSGDNAFRRNVEILHSGVLGTVREAHVWVQSPFINGRVFWPQGVSRPAGADPVPSSLDWESWLGTAPARPYKAGFYHPFNWRGCLDFGGGAFGDMGCHTMNLPFRGLRLGVVAEAECLRADDRNSDTFPSRSAVRLRYAAREGLPAVDLFWYDGGLKPSRELMPQAVATLGEVPKSGSLIVGEKGIMISAGDYGETAYVAFKGEAKIRSVTKHEAVLGLPQTVRRCKIEERAELTKEARLVNRDGEWKMISMGVAPSRANHRSEFVAACKGEGTCYSDVGVSVPMVEGVLLGCVAQRVPGRLAWDSEAQAFARNDAANALVHPFIRSGWEF
jgi:hypothetical protein